MHLKYTSMATIRKVVNITERQDAWLESKFTELGLATPSELVRRILDKAIEEDIRIINQRIRK